MPWEMQVNVPIEGKNNWVSIRPSCEKGVTPPPYRYDYEEDAELQLRKLYPNALPNEVRVKRV